MRITNVRIRRLASNEDGSAWKVTLEDPAWLERARVLKSEGAAWVRSATLFGRGVVVKCRPLNTLSRRVKAVLGFGHADRHWRGAAALRRIRVPTAKPFASARAMVDGQECELLVLEYLPGESLLDVLDAIRRGVGPPVREQHAIAQAAARTVNAILKGGKWNRDHKPSNLIVRRDPGAGVEIAIIDCVGIRMYPWMGMIDDGLSDEMVAALVIEPIGCGCPPRGALWMTALRTMMDPADLVLGRPERHASMRVGIEGVRSMVEAHGDPRPRVNPLGRAGGSSAPGAGT